MHTNAFATQDARRRRPHLFEGFRFRGNWSSMATGSFWPQAPAVSGSVNTNGNTIQLSSPSNDARANPCAFFDCTSDRHRGSKPPKLNFSWCLLALTGNESGTVTALSPCCPLTYVKPCWKPGDTVAHTEGAGDHCKDWLEPCRLSVRKAAVPTSE